MLVQYYFPQSLSPARLDRYLAAGWFRGANMLYRSQLICFKEDLYSVINIRLKLEGYTFSKSLRKVLKRNDARFRIQVGPAQVDEARERLYEAHKGRFKGFVFDNLYQFLYSDSWSSVFDTREIAVYDGDVLVALSYFDVGKNSMASLLGLYDHSYSAYSLGTYTMLLEIREAIQSGLKFYYPGYVLDGFDGFDYKLRLGNMQCYDWKGRWRPFENRGRILFSGQQIKEKVTELCSALSNADVSFTYRVNPFFSISYLEHLFGEFIQSCIYLDCQVVQEPDRSLIIEYIFEEDAYQLSWVMEIYKYQDFFEAELPNELVESNPRLLSYEDVIYRTSDLGQMVQKIKEILILHF